jgi:hypothetical protein
MCHTPQAVQGEKDAVVCPTNMIFPRKMLIHDEAKIFHLLTIINSVVTHTFIVGASAVVNVCEFINIA